MGAWRSVRCAFSGAVDGIVSRSEDWRRAFARQAQADLHAHDILCRHTDVPECQRLHFLQMACEKLVKAHLHDQSQSGTYSSKSHAVIANKLPMIVRYWHGRRTRGKRMRREMFDRVKHLAQQIELLAPAVDAGGRQPQNCEYPYQGPGGEVRCPATDSWPNLELATDPAGRLLLVVLPMAISDKL